MLIRLVKLQYYRAVKGFIILLNNIFKHLEDLNQVRQRLKHTLIVTQGIPHTWHTCNWHYILNTKPAHMTLHQGTYSTQSSANLHN